MSMVSVLRVGIASLALNTGLRIRFCRSWIRVSWDTYEYRPAKTHTMGVSLTKST